MARDRLGPIERTAVVDEAKARPAGSRVGANARAAELVKACALGP